MKQKKGRGDRGLFVVTRYVLITISLTSQWRPSTTSALCACTQD